MAYIIGLVIVAFFFFALHAFTELNLKQKSAIALTFLAVIGGAIYYNTIQDEAREHVRVIQLQYDQGKTLTCDGIEVNASHFTYSIGTQTFIGKENTPHYSRMINVSQCR